MATMVVQPTPFAIGQMIVVAPRHTPGAGHTGTVPFIRGVRSWLRVTARGGYPDLLFHSTHAGQTRRGNVPDSARMRSFADVRPRSRSGSRMDEAKPPTN